MVKKITKYLKFVVCCALIMCLVAPSYAALSASDGSAFVTKAEFDSALADFNARLTTFEAGINSKIDSQVTSYLDRNGIWNGAEQEFWDFRFATDSFAQTYRAYVADMAISEISVFAKLDWSATNWSAPIGVGGNFAFPLIKSISKSGLLAYNIPMIYWSGNGVESFAGIDTCLTFVETSLSNLTSGASYVPINLQDSGQGVLKSPLNGALKTSLELALPYATGVIDKTKATYFTSNFMPSWIYAGQRTQNYFTNYLNEPATNFKDLFTEHNRDYDGVTKYYYSAPSNSKNVTGYVPWSGSYEGGNLSILSTNSVTYLVTIFSGYTFVAKNNALLFCPASGGGLVWTSRTVPVHDNWLRTSGELLKLDVY